MPAQMKSASASSTELRRIERQLEQGREDENNEAELVSPSVASDGTRSLPVTPAVLGDPAGNEQTALLGSSESSLEAASHRLSTEDSSRPRFSSGPRYAKASSGESNELRGADSCGSWCEQLLDRLCGKKASGGDGDGGGGCGGDMRDNGDTDRAVVHRNDAGGAPKPVHLQRTLVAQPVAESRSVAAAGDLFADFEAKAKLFEQLAADASVEVSFVEQEEQGRSV